MQNWIRRRLPIVVLLIAVLAMTACGGLTPSASKLSLPEEHNRPCEQPVKVGKDLTNLQVERLWRADRIALVECETRRSGVVKIVKEFLDN